MSYSTSHSYSPPLDSYLESYFFNSQHTHTAEEYHQDYYIKNPLDYGYYKNGCRRPQRLKEVWGTDVYKCYHDEEHTCFVAEPIDGDNSNSNSTVPQILNANGELVDAESNLKMVDPEQVGRLPSWAKWVIGIVVSVLLVICGVVLVLK